MNTKLNFIIVGESGDLRTHQIAGLCDYLTAKVLEPKFAMEGHRWDRRFMNFFTFDNGCDPLEPTGTILFNVPSLFAGRVLELERAINQELSELGIETGPFSYQKTSERHCSQTIVIPVIDNPTVLLSPPEVNVAFSRGCVVLRDLLGYQQINGRYEFAADDLLKRVSSVTEEKIADCTASPLLSEAGVHRTPSPSGMRALKRCLEEIRTFALWATKHNYRALAAI